MFDMTTKEAAEKLGISPGRIHQLIKSGSLDAEKVGSIWLVDSVGVEARAKQKPMAGRPSEQANPTDVYTLMNRQHEVLTFQYDPTADVFRNVVDIKDPKRAPFGIMSPRGKNASASSLDYWWKHRCIPARRSGIDAKLKELGIADTSGIPFKSLGLSLSDQYWIRPQSMDIDWDDINFFNNSFDDMKANEWLSEVGLDSPDNTSEGMLSKAWICAGKKRHLLKGGGLLNQEPYNEAVATNLHSRLLSGEDFVAYDLEKRGKEVVSKCECFLTDEEEFIPAFYVKRILKQPPYRDDFHHYIECCAKLGVIDAKRHLQQMIVCDDLIANTDRHWRNFGIIRNVETLEYRTAPLFDSGTSLWSNVQTQEMAYASYAFETKPFREDADAQLRLVDDFSWLDFDALSGFGEDAVEILEANPMMEGRLDFIYGGIQSRIDRLMAIA